APVRHDAALLDHPERVAEQQRVGQQQKNSYPCQRRQTDGALVATGVQVSSATRADVPHPRSRIETRILQHKPRRYWEPEPAVADRYRIRLAASRSRPGMTGALLAL